MEKLFFCLGQTATFILIGFFHRFWWLQRSISVKKLVDGQPRFPEVFFTPKIILNYKFLFNSAFCLLPSKVGCGQDRILPTP